MLSQKVHTENARKFYFELFGLSIKNNPVPSKFVRQNARTYALTLIKMERRKT